MIRENCNYTERQNLFSMSEKISLVFYQEIEHKYSREGIGVPLHAMETHGGRGGIAPTHT
jgi:hypothetical protein